MSAQIIDGRQIAASVRAEWKLRAEKLIQSGGVTPGLAVIIVGDNPASSIYVRNKVKACSEIGIFSEVHSFSQDTQQQDVLDCIHALNQNPHIHGILVQLPLPPQFENNRVITAIAVEKDVDGFHLYNIGALVTGNAQFLPCTPYGVIVMLERHHISIEGQHAVVVGRSNIVGKPMALMLLERGATVTVCTSKTRDLSQFTKQADILVVATGKPRLITGDMVKAGAVVIDVGINRLPDGTLCGDVDYESVKSVADYLTPVPGGVGPMTITMLLCNTILAAERAHAGINYKYKQV
ncbi:bifunctional methylenetetrahydrofolate dehydrogenase/methenyltetrahydrofolate cyclohydrolase FolD [Nitrosomonas sp. JL21]|uniref:bifunctional methylenetetrahydrofolate dehydrogenase/methenyltetrahydrofolate cyclohydrolase FolD n=1 Tax=Nitrosomonas sp. JL21 TaxID=153949 RepID=UPI00136F8A5C|nr:bifunctional methylenetetrahydrofolate dehydrogenase/methenyltetrahydrofolate cyclohydrolase FolD [Nitrosomonas sp. JL21]MBL8496296.1 bifunctional methylenetetrahydrofolate dehydrogenase/methenyltetrahydrofolate cyclohydrolase FolD [Nitrosomonas sp.]MXS76937.1 bifunctional methylenetetrahydrofolate dehydrogenase/methenyltetrahydrofolate cyclohydrolase FolD [Nitrosomonas sp. JL21]